MPGMDSEMMKNTWANPFFVHFFGLGCLNWKSLHIWAANRGMYALSTVSTEIYYHQNYKYMPLYIRGLFYIVYFFVFSFLSQSFQTFSIWQLTTKNNNNKTMNFVLFWCELNVHIQFYNLTKRKQMDRVNRRDKDVKYLMYNVHVKCMMCMWNQAAIMCSTIRIHAFSS